MLAVNATPFLSTGLAVSCCVPPMLRLALEGENVTLLRLGVVEVELVEEVVAVPAPLTVIGTFCVTFEDPEFSVTVIVAVPAVTPVTIPLDDTVATDGLLEE